jgi:hypothetical protein
VTRPLVLEAFDVATDGEDFAPMSFDPPAAEFADEFAPAPAVDLSIGDETPATDDEAEYERGYRAGWDDCERRAQEARQAVGAELGRHIQELGFTYQEARAHVLGSIEPLLTGLVEKVLPKLAADTLGQTALEELTELAEHAAETPVTILVSPGNHDLIAGFLEGEAALPYRLSTEETLTDGQLFFRLGEHERQIDLEAVIARIGERLAAFSTHNQKVLNHG